MSSSPAGRFMVWVRSASSRFAVVSPTRPVRSAFPATRSRPCCSSRRRRPSSSIRSSRNRSARPQVSRSCCSAPLPFTSGVRAHVLATPRFRLLAERLRTNRLHSNRVEQRMINKTSRRVWHWSPGTSVLFGVLVATTAHAQSVVSGRVIDSRSELPLAGVSIEVEGTRLGASTDADGRYRIANVAAGERLVIARRIGYTSGRSTVGVAAGQPATADFRMAVSAMMLDEVVVTGTAGGELRRSIGNTVATIDAADMLAKSASKDLTSLLSARAQGLNVFPTTGRLGAGPSIQIRGRSSIGLSNSPLVYVDGVRVNSASGQGPVAVSGGLAGQGSQVGGRLNDLNPDDIESIEVISGPAAATIYGTEAASGVIQIITKHGRSGDRPALSFRGEEIGRAHV